MGHKNLNMFPVKGLIVVTALIVAFTPDVTADERQRLTKGEAANKIKELLNNRPEPDEGPDIEENLESLFDKLDSIADGMPDDFEFNVKTHGPRPGHRRRGNVNVMKCLNNANQLTHFLVRVKEVLKELRDEYQDDVQASIEDDGQSKNNDMVDEDDSNGSNSTNTDSNDTPKDPKEDQPSDPTDGSDDQTDTGGGEVMDDGARKKRDMGMAGFDLDELLDRLEDDDMDCLTGFIGDKDEKFLCRRYARRSATVFKKLLDAGQGCEDYLLDEDKSSSEDDRDMEDDLDESHQRALLDRFMDKESGEISDDDVKKMVKFAGRVIGGEFLDKLSDDLFKKNLHAFGRLATRGNPGLRYWLRERYDDTDFESLDADDLEEMGTTLYSFRLNQIEKLNGSFLLDADLSDMFDNMDSSESSDEDDDDEDDDDDKDDVRFALGKRMKEAIRRNGLKKNQVGRAMRFLHDDVDFIREVDPEDMFDALSEIRDIDYDDDDVKTVYAQMSKSKRFPKPDTMTAGDLTKLGPLMSGMGVSEMAEVAKEALEDALDQIKDIDFDDSQAGEIMEHILEDKNVERYLATDIRKLGKLVRGMPTRKMMELDDDIVEEVLDDLNDIDLSDAQKRVVMAKVRKAKMNPKFLDLDDFAEMLSVDDLEDFSGDDVKAHISKSSLIKWSLPQAAALAGTYKKANGVGRLRPSDLAIMRHFARGLLPEDFEDMADTQDDVLDIAEQLKDIKEDLTSGLIEKLVEKFNEASDLDNKEVVIDAAEAMQGAHILAYLTPEHFNKLEFTKAGKIAFGSQVSRMSPHKMARTHIKFLARKILDMQEDIETDDSKNKEKQADRASRRLRSLGNMAMGLTPSQIQGFDGNAIIDNLDKLRTLALSAAQAKAVLKQVDDADERWRCKSQLITRVGPLLQHDDNPFSEDCDFNYQEELLASFTAIMKGLEKRRENVLERLKEGFDRENDDAINEDGEKRLIDAMVSTAAARQYRQNVRVRRETEPVACDIIASLRGSVNHLDINRLTAMTSAEFKNCFSKLGAISNWSQEKLEALANKAKSVFNGVDTWSNEIIRRAGSIIAGLSLAEIQKLSISGVDALHSVGKHGNLSPEQLKAGVSRWMTVAGKKGASEITEEEFGSMSEFVCGLNLNQIHEVEHVVIKRSLSVVGNAMSCSDEQRQAYLRKARKTMNGAPVNTWSPATVSEMKHLIGALSKEDIKMLTRSQIPLIEPTVIQHLPSDKLAAMTSTQLRTLSSNQANAITSAQYKALNADQKKIVNTFASVPFEGGAGEETGKGGGKDGASCALPGVINVVLLAFATGLFHML